MGIIERIKETIFKIKDYDRLESDYCTCLCYFTNNKMSKPNYKIEVVKEVISDIVKTIKERIIDHFDNHLMLDSCFSIGGLKNDILRIVNEVKQVEQKSADKSKIKPKFKTGDRVIGIVSGIQYFITEVCDDHYNTESGCRIMFCSQDNFELYEQNPAWSEEDETKIKSIIALLKSPALCAMDGNKGIIDESIKYLKSLKDRVQPQHKEWSEEDDAIRNDLINYFRGSALETSEKEVINWLKSLKPQNRWKPSEGQLECLGYAIDKAEIDWSPLVNNRIYLTLKALKEQLEKL